MSIPQLVQNITSLPIATQAQLIEYYQAIDFLYKKYGNRLIEKAVMSDIASLITQTQESIGLDKVHELCIQLAKINLGSSIELTVPDNYSGAQSQVEKKFDKSSVHVNSNNELGVKIHSDTGQQYSRNIDKDIHKLIR